MSLLEIDITSQPNYQIAIVDIVPVDFKILFTVAQGRMDDNNDVIVV